MDLFNTCSPLGMTFCIGLITLLLFMWYIKKRNTYWKDRGVPYINSYPFFGVWRDRLFGEPFYEILNKRYFSMPPVYGYFEGNRPALSVADPRLLRDIFVKDFYVFQNRRLIECKDKTAEHSIAHVEGEVWKRIRSAMTPAFSSGKLKKIMFHFKECSKTLLQNLKECSDRKQPINMIKFYKSYLMDAGASSLFSTKIDSHNSPENKFIKSSSKSVVWRFALYAISPSLMKFFNISLNDPVARNFFWDAVTQIIEERKRNKQIRTDFLQILLDLVDEKPEKDNDEYISSADQDLLKNYTPEKIEPKEYKVNAKKFLTLNEVISQCASFFRAGFETSGLALTLASYFLALNQNIQEKARQEITECLRDTKGELTYEALRNMEYLDNIISETFRIHSPAIRTERRAETDYTFRGTDITIEKGTFITIPMYSMQRDPKYYPDPEKFDPDRFTKEEISKRDPYVYLPFGAGPRFCIGRRFALLEIKVCLIYVISCFNVKTCSQTQIPVQFNKGYELLQLKDVYLLLEPTQERALNL